MQTTAQRLSGLYEHITKWGMIWYSDVIHPPSGTPKVTKILHNSIAEPHHLQALQYRYSPSAPPPVSPAGPA
jgi:hypothetical protein